MSFEFVPAAEADIAGVVRLFSLATAALSRAGIDQWNDFYPAETDAREDFDAGALRVLRDGEGIAATFAYGLTDGGRTAELSRLTVRPSIWRRGIGAAALDFALNDLTPPSVRTVRLCVFEKNPAARSLYASRGFTETGEVFYPSGRFIVMEKYPAQ